VQLLLWAKNNFTADIFSLPHIAENLLKATLNAF
jgi:hypothetical protein